MATEQLERAKALLKAKRYDEARIILEGLWGDPTAERWLAKLNEIDPPEEFSTFAQPSAPPAERAKSTVSAPRDNSGSLSNDSNFVYYQSPDFTVGRKTVLILGQIYSVKHLTSAVMNEHSSITPSNTRNLILLGLFGGFLLALWLASQAARFDSVSWMFIAFPLIGASLGFFFSNRRTVTHYQGVLKLHWSSGETANVRALDNETLRTIHAAVGRAMAENQ